MSPATPTEPHLVPSIDPRPVRIRKRTPLPLSAPQSPITIVYRPPSELVVSRESLRKYQSRYREHLLQLLRYFGFVQPILIGDDMRVIAGHHILAAAIELSFATVPTTILSGLKDTQARVLRIALHKLPELSSWDEPALKKELAALADFDIELLTFTAFSSAELDVIFNASEGDHDDALPSPPRQPVSQLGDIWHFESGHRLGCLDVLCDVSLPALMAGLLASLIICDGPYNVPIAGHVTSRPGAREFAMASGEMSPEEFTSFLRSAFELLSAHAKDGSLSLQFMDWRQMGEMLEAGHAVYGQLLNLAVWAKTNPGMGSLWRSGHELCFVWKKGTAPHINNVELGRNGRNRSNLWTYPGASGFARGSDATAGST